MSCLPEGRVYFFLEFCSICAPSQLSSLNTVSVFGLPRHLLMVIRPCNADMVCYTTEWILILTLYRIAMPIGIITCMLTCKPNDANWHRYAYLWDSKYHIYSEI